MFATKMIKARLDNAKHYYGTRYRLGLVLNDGTPIEVRPKCFGLRHNPIKKGEDILLVDVAGDEETKLVSTAMHVRLYLDFEVYNLTHTGSYAVWVFGPRNTPETDKLWAERGYEQLSAMMCEWFTIAEDETDLTMLMMEHGKFKITNQLMTRK